MTGIGVIAYSMLGSAASGTAHGELSYIRSCLGYWRIAHVTAFLLPLGSS